MNFDHSQRPSFFWPLLLSLILVHLPLLYFLFLTDWQTPLNQRLAQIPSAQQPVMLNLQSLPLLDLAKPQTEQIPDQASAVAEYNTKADVETVVPSGMQNPPAQQVPITKTVQQTAVKQTVKSQPNSKPENKTDQQKQPPAETMPSENSEPKNLKDILAKLNSKQKTDEAKLDTLFKSQSAPSDASFKASFEPSGDFLPNYKLGSKTFVNAAAFPHVSYFVEMKRKYRTAWNPHVAMRGKNISRPFQIEVVWGCTIDQNGNLVQLELIQSSSISDYDMEAKRTIIASAPYSPLPTALKNEVGQLYVAWAFVYYSN